MRRVIDLLARCAGVLTVLGLAAACGSGGGKPGGTVTVTVPPSPRSPSSTTPTSGSSTSPATVSPGTTVPAATRTKLNGTCDSLLPDYLVTQELGAQLAGQDAFVVGVPDATIGRLTTINCRYGVAGAAATPKVEIGISLYRTPAQATARIAATVDDYVAHGATSADTTIGGVPAMQLSGGSGAGYDVPLLVLATDQRTVAIGVATGAVKDTAAASVKLAALTLKRTAA